MKRIKLYEEFIDDIVNEARTIVIPDNMRIHMSKTPITLQKKKYSQVDGMKPNGFWYGFGKEWIDWTKTEMPEWTGKYIYEVKIPNNILKITSYKELLQFNEEFKIDLGVMRLIDWKKVASKYNGIEIAPYQYKAKMDLLWYYGWDIGSGCVWNLDNASLLKINEDFINEGQFILRDLEDKYKIDLDLYDNGNFLELSRIVIPKDKRGKGIGSEIMNHINDYADLKGLKIYLTPSKDFGASSVSRLEKFYKDHGFIKNVDKSETRNTMVRLPQ